MTDPVLHLLVGPNGAGKSTFFERVLGPSTHLEFVNADVIAASHWPGREVERAYDAARLAAEAREALIATRQSFAAETVFSHDSKVDLVHRCVEQGYLVSLHVILVPADLAVARVRNRVDVGGHAVPEEKIRDRYARLWTLVRAAITLTHEAFVYDNSRAATPFRLVATFRSGQLTGDAAWPTWTPNELRAWP